MSKHRYAKKIDANQPEIVKQLRKLGISVELDHDDIICGWEGKTYWFEIKDVHCVSKRTGHIKESAKKDSQKVLEKEFKGHYKIVSSFDEILVDIGVIPMKCRKCGGKMKKGKATGQTMVGTPDFVGGEVCTVSPGGTGKLIDCMKCVDCGWSVTA